MSDCLAILEKEIQITLSSKTIPYYENLNYKIPRYIDKQGRPKVKAGTKIFISIDDLPPKSNIRLTKVCDDCGTKVENVIYSNIVRDRDRLDGKDRCEKCGKVNMGIRRKSNVKYENSLEYHIENNSELSYLIDEFSENNTKKLNAISKCTSDEYLWSCPKCNSEYDMSVSKRVNGRCCPYCSGYRINDTNTLQSLNPKLAKEWHSTKNGKLTPHNVTCGNNNKVWWICGECRNEWKSIISNRALLGRGCPICSESKGEKCIREWLENNEIKFISQKEFDGLIGLGGGNLSYDFYLTEHNLLIEYQGEFHDGSTGEYSRMNLDKQQEHDRRKRKYTEKNGIKLLEIWYWDFDRIEEILEKELNNKEELNE